MTTTKSELARVIVDGPAIPKPGGPQSKPWSYPPFWSLVATAPMFGLDRVEPDPREALQEDSIHPVRTLLLQPSGPADAFRRPRLLTLHLIAGQPKESAYGQKGAAGEPTEEALQIRLKSNLKDPVVSEAFGSGGDLRFSTLDGGGPGCRHDRRRLMRDGHGLGDRHGRRAGRRRLAHCR